MRIARKSHVTHLDISLFLIETDIKQKKKKLGERDYQTKRNL